jgi:hypothetical protein
VKPLFKAAGALGLVALAAQIMTAVPIAAEPDDATIWLVRSSEEAGFPGGRGGASGHASDQIPTSGSMVRTSADPLRRSCIGILGANWPGTVLDHEAALRPRDCVELFALVFQAQVGQPGRGGDGGGFPGLPGGRGGDSGAPGGSFLPGLPGGLGGGGRMGVGPEDIAVDPLLVAYCIDVLQSRGRVTSDSFIPADCAYYLLALDRVMATKHRSDPLRSPSGSAQYGADGPSIGGGVGGRGGRAGSGPGGGRGGAGGAGIGGGMGGAGGAGGASR